MQSNAVDAWVVGICVGGLVLYFVISSLLQWRKQQCSM
jgi:hypothetical protein